MNYWIWVVCRFRPSQDLAVEGKYGVNFINYWVDEKNGVVVCLSEAKDSTEEQ